MPEDPANSFIRLHTGLAKELTNPSIDPILAMKDDSWKAEFADDRNNWIKHPKLKFKINAAFVRKHHNLVKHPQAPFPQDLFHARELKDWFCAIALEHSKCEHVFTRQCYDWITDNYFSMIQAMVEQSVAEVEQAGVSAIASGFAVAPSSSVDGANDPAAPGTPGGSPKTSQKTPPGQKTSASQNPPASLAGSRKRKASTISADDENSPVYAMMKKFLKSEAHFKGLMKGSNQFALTGSTSKLTTDEEKTHAAFKNWDEALNSSSRVEVVQERLSRMLLNFELACHAVAAVKGMITTRSYNPDSFLFDKKFSLESATAAYRFQQPKPPKASSKPSAALANPKKKARKRKANNSNSGPPPLYLDEDPIKAGLNGIALYGVPNHLGKEKHATYAAFFNERAFGNKSIAQSWPGYDPGRVLAWAMGLHRKENPPEDETKPFKQYLEQLLGLHLDPNVSREQKEQVDQMIELEVLKREADIDSVHNREFPINTLKHIKESAEDIDDIDCDLSTESRTDVDPDPEGVNETVQSDSDGDDSDDDDDDDEDEDEEVNRNYGQGKQLRTTNGREGSVATRQHFGS